MFKKISLFLLISSIAFANSPIKYRGEESVTMDRIPPHILKIIDKANYYGIVIGPLKRKTSKTYIANRYEIKEFAESAFSEFALEHELIDRVENMIKHKIMKCQNEKKVSIVNDDMPSGNDPTCLYYPRDERSLIVKKKIISPNELFSSQKENIE